jgi:hypothetical protein
LKSYAKWRSPLFGATCNFNDQILPYGILFLTFINTNDVDIISRAIKLRGELQAKQDLALKQGNDYYDYTTGGS